MLIYWILDFYAYDYFYGVNVAIQGGEIYMSRFYLFHIDTIYFVKLQTFIS
jgi:hypothetical protein